MFTCRTRVKTGELDWRHFGGIVVGAREQLISTHIAKSTAFVSSSRGNTRISEWCDAT